MVSNGFAKIAFTGTCTYSQTATPPAVTGGNTWPAITEEPPVVTPDDRKAMLVHHRNRPEWLKNDEMREVLSCFHLMSKKFARSLITPLHPI